MTFGARRRQIKKKKKKRKKKREEAEDGNQEKTIIQIGVYNRRRPHRRGGGRHLMSMVADKLPTATILKAITHGHPSPSRRYKSIAFIIMKAETDG